MKVCFVSLYAYSLFDPSTSYVFGGAEVRTWNLVRGLARLPDFQTACVVLDHGQPSPQCYDRVLVHAHSYYKARENLKNALTGGKLGLLRPAWGLYVAGRTILRRIRWKTRLALMRDDDVCQLLTSGDRTRIYAEVDADVYCIIGVTNLAAEVMAFCRQSGKKSILLLGSDNDLSENYRRGDAFINQYGDVGHLCHYALTTADMIVAQTRRQAELVSERFGRRALELPNPIDLSIGAVKPPAREPYALWIGKSDAIKRPRLMLDLARRLPSIRFVLVMNRSHPDLHSDVVRSRPDNVQIVERLSYRETEALIEGACVLVNTSAFEGFPNTFLQAGKYGVPVLSLAVDPDEMLEGHGCGFCAHGDMEAMARSLADFMGANDKARIASERIRSYVDARHELGQVSIDLASLLRTYLAERHVKGDAIR